MSSDTGRVCRRCSDPEEHKRTSGRRDTRQTVGDHHTPDPDRAVVRTVPWYPTDGIVWPVLLVAPRTVSGRGTGVVPSAEKKDW